MTDTIFTDKELKLSLRNSRALQDSPPLQMRTITYNIMRLHSGAGVITLMGTRLLPSRDDCDKNFSGTLKLR
jgi:hypothetical protein